MSSPQTKLAVLGMGAALLGSTIHTPDPMGPVVPKQDPRDPPPPKLPKGATKRAPIEQGWKPLDQVGFSNGDTKQFHCDTRDFYVKTSKEPVPDLDIHKTRKNPERYFHTSQEFKDLLNHLMRASGGPGEWRKLTLVNIFRAKDLTYIHGYRYPQGILVTNSDGFVFNKQDLAAPVDQNYLYFIPYPKTDS